MPSSLLTSAAKRLHFAPIAITTGVLATALLSLSMTGTLSGFIATITNDTNTAASGSLVMQETGPAAATCTSSTGGLGTNSATCSTINKFGGLTTMVPGQSVTTTVTITNLGSVTGKNFTLAAPSACVQSANGAINGSALDLCSKLNVVITSGTSTPVFSGTAANLANATALTTPAITQPANLAPGASLAFNFTVTLDSSAGNTYQGLGATMPLVWSFTS